MKPVIIGIAGGSGSGKTTVARNLVEDIAPGGVAVISQDSYYHDLQHLDVEERAKTNFDHPNSIDWDLMFEQLRDLRSGKAIEVPIYNYARHTRQDECLKIEPSRVVVVEGILVLVDKRLRQMMDIKLFVDIAADIRFIRRLNRDVRERGRSLESVIDQYERFVRPMHLEFVEPSKRHADVIIPVGGQNKIAVDMVRTKIRDVLQS